MISMFFTCGYLVTDWILLQFVIGVRSAIDKQTIAHHTISFVTMYAAFWQQDYTVVFGTMLLFVEISTLFVTARWLMFAHDMKGGHPLQSANSFALFITFIFGRVFYQLYACL